MNSSTTHAIMLAQQQMLLNRLRGGSNGDRKESKSRKRKRPTQENKRGRGGRERGSSTGDVQEEEEEEGDVDILDDIDDESEEARAAELKDVMHEDESKMDDDLKDFIAEDDEDDQDYAPSSDEEEDEEEEEKERHRRKKRKRQVKERQNEQEKAGATIGILSFGDDKSALKQCQTLTKEKMAAIKTRIIDSIRTTWKLSDVGAVITSPIANYDYALLELFLDKSIPVSQLHLARPCSFTMNQTTYKQQPVDNGKASMKDNPGRLINLTHKLLSKNLGKNTMDVLDKCADHKSTHIVQTDSIEAQRKHILTHSSHLIVLVSGADLANANMYLTEQQFGGRMLLLNTDVI